MSPSVPDGQLPPRQLPPVTRSQTLGEVAQTGGVWVVRHGERADVVDPDWHLTAARPHDPPLTEHGFAQAAATGVALRGERVDAVYTSPFLRCVQTAAAVAKELGAPLRVEPGLCEWINKDWFGDSHDPMDEGMATRELERVVAGIGGCKLDASYQPLWDSSGRAAASAGAAFRAVAFPESSEEAVERYESTVAQLRERDPYSVLVTHGYGVWTMAEWLLQRDVTEDCGYCCVTRARRAINKRGHEGWRCDVVADEAHLEALGGEGGPALPAAPLGVRCVA